MARGHLASGVPVVEDVLREAQLTLLVAETRMSQVRGMDRDDLRQLARNPPGTAWRR